MKKLFVAIAMIMTTVIAMAQSQLYVIMKDGSGTSFPESSVDEITFDNENGATIFGLKDLANSVAKLRKDVDSLLNVIKIMSSTATEIDPASHDYVDLDLPSGTLWATTNVGALKPEEYGFRFAWGETEAHKYNFTSSNYALNGKSATDLHTEKIIDGLNNLTPKYDAATVFWGDDWRMPTTAEVDELLKNCNWEWTDYKGVNGILFTSKKNENSIFLPCAGYFNGNDLLVVGENGYYLNSTYYEFGGSSGTLYLFKDRVFNSTMKMSHGRSVRPVKRKDTDPEYIGSNDKLNGQKFVDLGLPSGRLWAKEDVKIQFTLDNGLFQWGDGWYKSGPFLNDGYKWNDYTPEKLIEKNIINDSYNLTLENDPLTHVWGNKWRTPTKDDYIELIKNCEIEYVEPFLLAGAKLKFTGPNGNSIEFDNLEQGRWTSTSSSDSKNMAYGILFKHVEGEEDYAIPTVDDVKELVCFLGMAIRPVSDMIIKK